MKNAKIEKITQKYIQKSLKKLKKYESMQDYNRHCAIINTKQELIDISMKDLRNLAKQLSKMSFVEYLTVAKDTSFEKEFYEETLLQGILISSFKDLSLQIENLEWWVKKIDNWAACDSVSASLKILKKSKEKHKYFQFFYNMSQSTDEFVSRFGLVTIMNCYLESEYISQILELCRLIKSDKYYVNMALAWLISFCFMKFRDETYKLMNEQSLPKFVQNKAISKCRDSYQVSNEDKEKLIKLRIE